MKTSPYLRQCENILPNDLCATAPGFTRAITRCAATAAGAFCGLSSAEYSEGEREGLITQSDKAGRKETGDGWRKAGREGTRRDGGTDAWMGYSTLAGPGQDYSILPHRERERERESEPSTSSCSCERATNHSMDDRERHAAMRARINEASKRRFRPSFLPCFLVSFSTSCARDRYDVRYAILYYCPH